MKKPSNSVTLNAQPNVEIYVPQESKSKKVLNYGLTVACTGVIFSTIALCATYDNRIKTNQNKVLSGQTLNEKEAVKELENIEESLYTLYNSAENTFAKQKAVMYAERDVKGLNHFYNTSYTEQQQYLIQQRCQYNQNLEECKQFKRPLPQNVSRETSKKIPKTPFSFKTKSLPPPPVVGIKEAKKQIKKRDETDNINKIVVENNIRNIIKGVN